MKFSEIAFKCLFAYRAKFLWVNLFLHGKLYVAQIPEMHNLLQKKTRSSRHILSIQITLTTSSDYRIIAHNQQ